MGWYTLAQLRTLPAPEWLIPNYLPEHSLAQLCGPSQAYKTFLAIDWSCRLSCDGQRVAYLAAEGMPGLAGRFDAWESHHEARVPEKRLLVRSGASTLIDPKQAADLGKELRENGPFGLVVVDTWARFMAGSDLNSDSDVAIAVRNIASMQEMCGQPTVMVISHMGWEGTRQKGAKALYDSCDTVLYLTSAKKAPPRHSNDEDEDGYLIEPDPPRSKRSRLWVEKQKDGSPEVPASFLERTDVPGTGSCVLVPVNPRTKINASTNGHGSNGHGTARRIAPITDPLL